MHYLGGGLRAASRMLAGLPPDEPATKGGSAAVRASFLAVLICLPPAAFGRWVEWRVEGPASSPLWHAAGINLAAFVIGWAGFLLASRALLPVLKEDAAWPRLVCVWNWASVAQSAVGLIATGAALAGSGVNVRNVIGLVVLFWQTWIEWRALRGVLRSPWPAAGLVLLDIALSLLLQSVTVSLGG